MPAALTWEACGATTKALRALRKTLSGFSVFIIMPKIQGHLGNHASHDLSEEHSKCLRAYLGSLRRYH
jgi:hypothetical protein